MTRIAVQRAQAACLSLGLATWGNLNTLNARLREYSLAAAATVASQGAALAEQDVAALAMAESVNAFAHVMDRPSSPIAKYLFTAIGVGILGGAAIIGARAAIQSTYQYACNFFGFCKQ